MYNPTSQGMDLPFFSKSRAKADILFDLFYSVITRKKLNDLSMLKNKREHPLSQTCLELFCFADLMQSGTGIFDILLILSTVNFRFKSVYCGKEIE